MNLKNLPSPFLCLLVLGLSNGLSGCHPSDPPLFTAVEPDRSGIHFVNTLDETPEKNVMVYEYYYNGGGVAAADFNQDGWCDLYFTGNAVENKLYLNQGGRASTRLQFSDVTERAGVKGRAAWKTGVTVADVNGDGWLDIYVSYSGPVMKEQLYNELYINNGCEKGGVPTFTEKGKEYGLDAPLTFSTQASFFDYDRDGDLDMFLSNHGHRYYSPFFNTQKVRSKRHPQFGNRLYRNDTPLSPPLTRGDGWGVFTEVSEQAGIHGGGLNFGLSACAGDLNGDGWPDLYVTNDFDEQDYLYLNNRDGTFREVIKQATGHTSKFAMGSDLADFNNDLLPDLLVADMLPESLQRQKLLKGADEYDRYALMVDSGFHHQHMRNTLQLHRGNNDEGTPLFSEIGQLAGVYNTDWSWSAWMADLDNDGFKDIFITNGFLRDFTNLDFLKYTFQDASDEAYRKNTILPVYELIKKMPSTKLANFAFRNGQQLTFTNATADWGLDVPLMSFGSVYVDLDNDGDLELVTNNTNDPASVWENHANEIRPHHYVKVQLKGKGLNTFAIGAKVYVEGDSLQQVQELVPSRGFQSSMDYVLNFGLGAKAAPLRVRVVWPDGTESVRNGLLPDTLHVFDQSEAEPKPLLAHEKGSPALFTDYTLSSKLQYQHRNSPFVDFKRELLLPYQLSQSGPFLAAGDVNGDGLDDLFAGAAAGYPARLFIQQADQSFREQATPAFIADQACHDMGSVLFDADGDLDLDLYVVSGGTELPTGAPTLMDRLYLNDGRGQFTRAPRGAIPDEFSNGTCVRAGDFDRDGDLDLYVGSGVEPGSFPFAGFGGILRNDSDPVTHTPRFSLATREVGPDLKSPGMVTDAVWTDWDGDQWPDLVIAGEWMPVRFFKNEQGKLREVQPAGLEHTGGLWSTILADDLDGDGDVDLVVGNAGLNLPWKPTATEPLVMYAADFDENGKVDPIICVSQNGKEYPIASRDELLEQIPALRKKFVYYKDYSQASLTELFDAATLRKARRWEVQTLATSYFLNRGNGTFEVRALPTEAQFSRVNGLLTADYDGDGHPDLLIAGNYYPYRVQYGHSDASLGLMLKGNGKGAFQPVDRKQSGLYIPGDVRSMVALKANDCWRIVIGKNNAGLQVIGWPEQPGSAAPLTANARFKR